MQLTRRSLILLLGTVIPIILTAWTPLAGWLTFFWLVLVLALLVADWRLSPKPGDWELKRHHDERLSLAIENPISVEIRLRRGLRALPIWLRDEPPIGFGLVESQEDRETGRQEDKGTSVAIRILLGSVSPGSTTTLTYTVRPPRRGDYKFEDLHLRWGTALGLLRCQHTFAAAEPVKVYPNLVDVRRYDLLLRKNRLWELGVRNTRLIGSGTDFERLRDYLPDDDYRRINWKATARRGKPISAEFQTERSQNIIALLDTGRMMRSPVGDVEKLDYAVNAVLLLAFVAAQKGDKVGLLTFADTAQTWIAPRSGKVQFQRMLEQLYAVNGQQVEPDYNRAFAWFNTQETRRSLVLVFTDLTGSVSGEALVAQMTRLRQRHLPLLVTVADPTVQKLARQPITEASTLYQRTVAEQLLDERRTTLERLRHHGVLTLDVPADELSIGVINRYLEIKAQGMI
ncbi:MAG: DUF58 domain-containing protein [Caldilineaceae bacterium]